MSQSDDSPAQPPATDDQLQAVGRQLGAYTVAFANAVAERLGINRTDYECLDLLDADGPMTAGQLASRTGLTSGAVTGVIDRLERARLVRRTSDPQDRRRVIVEPIDERADELADIFEPYGRRWSVLTEGYSPDQLAVLSEYIRGAVELLQDETRRVRQLPRHAS